MSDYPTPPLPKGMFFRVKQKYNHRGEAIPWYTVQVRWTRPWWLRWLGSEFIAEETTTRTKLGVYTGMKELAAMVSVEVRFTSLCGDYPPKKL